MHGANGKYLTKTKHVMNENPLFFYSFFYFIFTFIQRGGWGERYKVFHSYVYKITLFRGRFKNFLFFEFDKYERTFNERNSNGTVDVTWKLYSKVLIINAF